MLQPGSVAVLITSGVALSNALVIPLINPVPVPGSGPSIVEDVTDGPTTVTLRPFDSRPRPTDLPVLGEEKEKEEIYLQFRPDGEVQEVDEDWWLDRYGDKSGILKEDEGPSSYPPGHDSHYVATPAEQQQKDGHLHTTPPNMEKRTKEDKKPKKDSKPTKGGEGEMTPYDSNPTVGKVADMTPFQLSRYKESNPLGQADVIGNSIAGIIDENIQTFPGKQGKLKLPKPEWDHYLTPGNSVDIKGIMDKAEDEHMKAHAQQKAQEFEQAKHDLLKAQHEAAQKSKEIIAAQDAIHRKAQEKADKARIEAEAEKSKAIWKAKQAEKTSDAVIAKIQADKNAAKLAGVVYPEDGQNRKKDKDGLLPVFDPTKPSSYEPDEDHPLVQLGEPYVAYHGKDVTIQMLDDIVKPDDPAEYYRGLSPDTNGV